LGIDPPDLVKSSFRRYGTSRGKLLGLLLAEMREHPANKECSVYDTDEATRTDEATPMPGNSINHVRESHRDVENAYFYLLCEIVRNSNERS
jgi:hypothetical protein